MRGGHQIEDFADNTGIRPYLAGCLKSSLQNLNSLKTFNRIFSSSNSITNRHERYHLRSNMR